MQDLTLPQLTVIQHVVAGATIAKAARLAHIHRSTVYVWMRSSPAFAAALERYQGILAEAAGERLRELVTETFDALEECLTGPESTPAIRFRAAAFILRHQAEIRHNSTPPPCDTLEATNHEGVKSPDSARHVRVSGTPRAGFRARRRTHLPPQMLRVSRQRSADEWPPPG